MTEMMFDGRFIGRYEKAHILDTSKKMDGKVRTVSPTIRLLYLCVCLYVLQIVVYEENIVIRIIVHMIWN